jgi:large subunit ribosomal protein L24
MKIKKGDNVKIIAGKDKGKTGKILKAMPKENRVVVAGINMFKKNQRPTKQGQKGQVVEKAMPLSVSNVMIVDPKSGKQTRVGMKKDGDKKVRVAKKSGTTLA